MAGLLAQQLFDAARSRATTRQARLLMVACCRLRAGQFFDPRIDLALTAAERCADDPAAEAEADALLDEIETIAPPFGPGEGVARAVWGAWRLVHEYPNEYDNG